MKQFIISLAAGALILAGCQRELLPEGDVNFGDGQIRYSVVTVGLKSTAVVTRSVGSLSLVSGDGKLAVPVTCEVSEGIDLGSGSAATKGALINTTGSDSALPADLGFTVSAYKGNTPQFTTQTAAKRGDYWTMDPPQYWPLSTKLTFYAYTNAGDNTVSQTATSQTLTYTVKEDVTAHKDLMLGYYKGNGGNKGIAEMHFDHPLTAVRFKKGEMTGVTGIKSITISGLTSGGTVAMDADGVIGNWTLASTEKYETAATLSGGETALGVEESSNLIGTDSEGKYNGAFLLIPQTLSDHDVTVTAVLSTESGDDVTVKAYITSGTWQAGMTNTYTLGYNPSSEDPDLLPGKFSVSAIDYVRFSRGNVQAVLGADKSVTKWQFAAHQYDFVGDTSGSGNLTMAEGSVVDLFGWSGRGGTVNWGISTSMTWTDYSSSFESLTDWGLNYGDGSLWETMTKLEWDYLFNRSSGNLKKTGVTVCAISNCLVLAPDDFEGTIKSSYNNAEWIEAEKQGLVCLPPAGYRYESTKLKSGMGVYWTSTIGNVDRTGFDVRIATPEFAEDSRAFGRSVRLVQKFDWPEVEPTFVDLGLPSGTQWADVNVGATSKTGARSYGKFYAWGETESKTTYTIDNYKFKSSFTEYNGTDHLTELQSEDDVAAAKVSGSHIPTRQQYEELINSTYTTCTWTDDYNSTGVPGLVITSKSNSNSIFLPAAGLQNGPTPGLVGENGCYWSRTLNPTPKEGEGTSFPACAIDLDFDKYTDPFVYEDDDDSRRFMGQSVRAVKQGAVKIGGVYWATKNVGAKTIAESPATSYGDYFAWGEVEPYYDAKNTSENEVTVTSWKSGKSSGYTWGTYCNNSIFVEWNTVPYNQTTKVLDSVHDAATKDWGSPWRMPTSEDFKKLYDACGGTESLKDITMATVADDKVTSKGVYWCGAAQKTLSVIKVPGLMYSDGNGNNLFFPATGYFDPSGSHAVGSCGYYWSSSLDSSDHSFAFSMAFSDKVYPQLSGYRNTGRTIRPVHD